MSNSADVKQTPLYPLHVELGGRMVEFAGYMMPVQYSGLSAEHAAVRTAVGLFDVSHMGEVEFKGPSALDAVHRLVTNNVLGLVDGKALYTPITYSDGGIVDDCLVYRLAEDHVLVVVNASNIQKDFDWFVEQTGDRCVVENNSDDYALLALQGREAMGLLSELCGEDLSALKPFWFREVTVAGVRCTASRTGYTGEDGFEILCAADDGPTLWKALMAAGEPAGILPCGLGARDTLRLEARLPLYGNDIDATTNPIEAGLGWTVKLKKGEFIGFSPIKAAKKKGGISRKLVCMEMRSRGFARQHHTIHLPGPDGGVGEEIGVVTSGTKSPTLGKGIALGYVPVAQAAAGTALVVDVRGKPVQVEVVPGPFYKREY